MRISSAVVFAAAFAGTNTACAFRLAGPGTTTRKSSALYAVRSGLPPPPPPPPPASMTSSAYDNVFSNLLDSPSSSESSQDPITVVSDIFRSLQDSLPSLPNLDDVDLFRGFAFDLGQLPLSADIVSNVNNLRDQIDSLDAQILAQLNAFASQIRAQMIEDYPSTMGPIFGKLTQLLQPLMQSPTAAILISALFTYVGTSALLTWGQPPPPSKPYPMNKYDPIAARAYFDRRLPTVLGRGLQVAVTSLQFGINLLRDKLDNKIAENEVQRGRELAVLLTKLGPTFIKVGQSLSIRTDLLSPAYQRGLETLQDQVPAFDTNIARQILEAEWGQPVNAVIDELTPKPIAAASLGQVYKAKLKSSGLEVAIKVQRPDITEQIALDMHLLREVAGPLRRIFNLNSDTVGTVDAWGKGFVAELDYIQEAASAEFFSEKIKETPLKDVVLAPAVVNELTTPQVLVTNWVDGQRLDKSNAGDVTVLCSIAMNTYLTMLLELGLLHCDPHPGNLLRTPDGRLCILDWGMVTELDENLQLTLIEHVAHLTSRDYAEIPKDLLLLGFIPENKKDLIQDSGVVELLTEIYGAWSSGGGAAAINVNDVVNKLQDLTAEKGNLFQIPAYFAYIAKSFSVLEGIGLSNDRKYSIINECLPYVSKRLLTDKEKCGPALSTFIFGPDKNNPDRIVDYDRVEQLIGGFGEYSTSASGALLGRQNASRVEVLNEAADQIIDLVFTEESTPLQEIIVDQTAKIVASSTRQLLSQLRERSGVLPSGRTVLGFMVDPLGLWRTSPLVRPNEQDERTVETTLKIVELMQRQAEVTKNPMFDLSNISREEAMALSSILVRKFWQRRSGVLQTGNRFMRRSFELVAEQLEKGERDSRTLPSRDIVPRQNSRDSAAEPAPVDPLGVGRAVESASKRLRSARKLLEGYSDEEAFSEAFSSAKPEPVSTRRTRG